MAIRSGQILYSADNGFIIDRLQQAGVTNLNIPLERIYEDGNYQSVGVVRDIPDLTFAVDTFDTSVELEALNFGGKNPQETDGATPSATYYDYNANLPIDIISPFRSSYNAYDIINGVAIPQLYLESISYRYAVQQNSSETWTYRGDSVYYIPGSPYLYQVVASGGQTVVTTPNTPILTVENGVNKYALNVSVNGIRQFPGVNYTETSGGQITFTSINLPTGSTASTLSGGDIVRVVYGSSTANTSFPTTPGSPAALSVKPAAVRAKDVNVYLRVPGATPDMVRWTGVQSAQLDWSVNLSPNYEFGNYHATSEDYVTALVKGSVNVRPYGVADLFSKIAQATNTPTNQVAQVLTSSTIEMEIRVFTPDTGVLIKTLYVPDARFQPPALNSRVNTKLEAMFNFESDAGLCYCYPGPNSPSGTDPLGNSF